MNDKVRSCFVLMFIPALVAFASVGFSSCGSGQRTASSAGGGTVSFTVEWEEPPSSAAMGELRPPAAAPLAPAIDVCTDYGIDQVTMTVLSGVTVLAESSFACALHQGTLNNIPAGDNLVLRLRANVPGQGTAWTGFSSTFALAAGESRNLGSVAMTYTGTDNTPPFVATVAPVDNEGHAPDNSVVRVAFSERMAVNTVIDNDAIIVVDNVSGRVPGTITYYAADNSARFISSLPLAQGARHTVTVSDNVTDMAGRRMAAPYAWNFTVHGAGSWGDPVAIENMDDYGSRPQIAMDNAGRAFVVWEHRDPVLIGFRNLWSNRYVPGSGWEGPRLLETDTGDVGPDSMDFSPNARIAMDDNGFAHVVWWQSFPPHFDYRGHIWWVRYLPGTGWETPRRLEAPGVDNLASNPRIAVERDGLPVIAAWVQRDPAGNTLGMWCSRYSMYGWGLPGRLATVSDSSNRWGRPQVLSDMVVWAQDNGVWAIDNPDPLSASAPVLVTAAPSDSITGLQIARDGIGNVIAVWTQYDGVRYDLWYCLYLRGTGWQTPAPLESDPGNAGDVQIIIHGDGTAIAVWSQNYSIWSRRYVPGPGWETPVLIQPGTASDPAESPRIAMNDSGSAIGVWGQSSTGWSSRYTPGEGWGTPIAIGQGVDFRDYQIAVDGSGNAVAVWSDWSGNVWAARNY